VIMADMNEAVTAPDLKKFCQSLQLEEAISFIHGRATVATHQRGSKPIDGIYVSRELLPDLEGGFLPFGTATHSDHRPVWIDLRADKINMEQTEPVVSPARRRLKCQDPRIVNRYNDALKHGLEMMTVEKRVESLFEAASQGTWTPSHEEEFNRVDQELTQVKLHAESQCRKLHAGQIPWTPALSQAIQRVQYWKGIEKHANGGNISTMVLKRRAIHGQEKFSEHHWQLSR